MYLLLYWESQSREAKTVFALCAAFDIVPLERPPKGYAPKMPT